MPIDSNIALGFRPHTEIQDPTNALAKFMQMQHLQQQGELGRMQMDQTRVDGERKNKLYGLMNQDYADGSAREAALLKGGFADEAIKLGTQRRADQKSDFDIATKRMEMLGQGTGWLKDNPSMQNAQAMVNHWVQNKIITPQEGQQKLQEFGADPTPEGIARYATMGYQAVLSAKDQAEAKHRALTFGETVRHNKAGEGIQYAQLGETKRHHGVTEGQARDTAAATMSKPFEVTGEDGLPVLVQQDKQGNLKRVEGFSPKAGAGGKMTEDQAKATGWLVQAENAWNNMKAVGLKDGKVTSAAKPGFNDGLAAIPSFGATEAIANTFRGADRQKFIQAASSLSEALLRAATGAGVNESEAAQKIRELTPVFGEDAEVTKQKFAAVPAYIESLKVRAGPGAVKAAGITSKPGGATPNQVASGKIFDEADAILRGGR